MIDFSQIFQRTPHACLLLAPDLVIVEVNATYLSTVGVSRDELVGRSVFAAFPPREEASLRQLRDSFEEVIRTGKAHSLDLLFFPLLQAGPEGETWKERFWSVTNTPVLDADGGVAYILNSVADVTALIDADAGIPGDGEGNAEELRRAGMVRRINRALALERTRLRQLVQQAPGFVAVGRGPDFVFELANTAYYSLVGHREILGKPVREALPELEGQGFYELLERVYLAGEPFIGRAMPIKVQVEPGGALVERHIDFIYQPIRDNDGHVSGIFVQGHDVSEAYALSLEVSHQAAHDSLTGLVNRREFERRLHHALDSLDGGAVHSVFYIDMDQFKIVNDTCGHSAGDALLRHVGSLLSTHVSPRDTLARLGGDEFGVLLENCPEATAARIANELRELIATIEFSWSKRVFACSISIGVKTFGADVGGIESVLSAADAACFLAKEKGRNRVQVHCMDDEELTSRRREMDWSVRLREALRDDRFVLYAQNIMPLQARHAKRHRPEVLIRLRDTDGSLVPPMAFIPAAERYGLMPAIDRWVITASLAYLAGRNKEHGDNAQISINLSGATLSDEGFAPFVEEILQRSDVAPEQVVFEVTETSALLNLVATSKLLNRLKALGVSFALDDFGSGMSSFGYLKHLPVDILKIDGLFIKNIATDAVDRAMVEAIARVASVMGLETVAEFVETQEVMELLAGLGIDFAQGYGVHVPEPLVTD